MLGYMVKNRYLVWVLSANDFRSQYVDSALGVVWSMIKPLVLIGLYALVFSTVITPTVRVDGAPLNFGLYLFAGMLPWTAIQESVQRSSTVFSDQASLVRHHTAPPAIYPLAVVLSSTISALFIITVFVAVRFAVTGAFPILSPFLLLVLPLQVLFSYGLSLFAATLNVFVRDVSHATATFLAVLFFTSPIIFPPDSVPAGVLALMWVNPITGFVGAYRDLLLVDRFPSPAAAVSILLFAAASMAAGLALYQRRYRQIVDWT